MDTVSTIIVWAFVVIGGGGGFFWGVWRRRRALARACELAGGELRPHFDRWKAPTAFVTNSGVRIRAVTTMTWTFRTRSTSCEIVADAPGGAPTFRVVRRLRVRSSAAFGDVPEFDARCSLDCEDREATHERWTPAAQALMVRVLDTWTRREGLIGPWHARLVCDGHQIAFERSPAFKRPESYLLAFDLLAELARPRD